MSTAGSSNLKMNGSSVKSDENSEMDRHLPSSKQLWRLNTDTGSSAPISNSTDYSRTTSSMSSYSEHSNERASSYDFPPVERPMSKPSRPDSLAFTKLSRLRHISKYDPTSASGNMDRNTVSEALTDLSLLGLIVVGLQRLKWLKINFQSFCWAKTCLEEEKESVQL